MFYKIHFQKVGYWQYFFLYVQEKEKRKRKEEEEQTKIQKLWQVMSEFEKMRI